MPKNPVVSSQLPRGILLLTSKATAGCPTQFYSYFVVYYLIKSKNIWLDHIAEYVRNAFLVERASSISWESPRPSHARSRPHGLPNQLHCFSDICDQTFIMPLFNYTKGRYYLLRKWRVAFQNSFPICTASYHNRYELHIHASPSSSHAQENFAQVCTCAHSCSWLVWLP